jgi:hypothetical protein
MSVAVKSGADLPTSTDSAAEARVKAVTNANVVFIIQFSLVNYWYNRRLRQWFGSKKLCKSLRLLA